MATPLVASCPECRKQIKASDELAGKKVRCKGCGHVFVIPAAAAEKPKPAPAKAKASSAAAEEEDGGNPYALASDTDEQVARQKEEVHEAYKTELRPVPGVEQASGPRCRSSRSLK